MIAEDKMIIIKNGDVVTPEEILRCDVAIDGKKIIKIEKNISPKESDEVIDATGLLVMPGFIDGHTHLDMEAGETHTADDFESGTIGAVCGGTTTIIDFATQSKGGTMAEGLKKWHNLAQGKARTNYAFHMAITDWNEKTKDELLDMKKAGVTSFKTYMAYDALKVTKEENLEILKAVKSVNGILGVHCEVGSIINELQQKAKAIGQVSPKYHPRTRPDAVEAEAIEELCTLGKEAQTEVMVVHLSTKVGLDVIRKARKNGQIVYAETCPHYLIFDESKYELDDFQSAKFVMSPPLRSRESVEALKEAVIRGEINTIATDHCSFNYKTQKTIGKDDFTKIPNGIPGVEHRPMLMMSMFKETLSPYELVKLLSENPAKIYGMYPAKGILREGSDGDLVIWDPHKEVQISEITQHQNVDYTPYEGIKVQGAPKYVLVNGSIAIRDGKLTDKILGEYVHR